MSKRMILALCSSACVVAVLAAVVIMFFVLRGGGTDKPSGRNTGNTAPVGETKSSAAFLKTLKTVLTATTANTMTALLAQNKITKIKWVDFEAVVKTFTKTQVDVGLGVMLGLKVSRGNSVISVGSSMPATSPVREHATRYWKAFVDANNWKTQNAYVPPPGVKKPMTGVACPTHYGYYSCTDPKFNPPNFNPGFAQVMNARVGSAAAGKDSVSAKDWCCKSTNVWGDPRPEVKSLVKKNIKSMKIASIVLAVITLPLSFVMPGVIPLVIDAVVTSGFGAATMVEEALYSENGFPYTNCQGPNPDKNDASKKKMIALDYKDSEGITDIAMFQSQNGCPIVFGTPEFTEYSVQTGRAWAQIGVWQNGGGGGKQIDDKDVRMLPFLKWQPGNKMRPDGSYPPPISCVMHGPDGMNDMKNCKNCEWSGGDGIGGECRVCKDKITVTCGQYFDNPDLTASVAKPNGYGTAKVHLAGVTDRTKYN